MTIHTDISFVNRWVVGHDGEPVRFFGWAMVFKSESGQYLGTKQGVETTLDENTTKMESRAVAIARAIHPDARIICDCDSAEGFDEVASPNDPFHQIAHFASRDALYTRLVTAGHSFKGRNKRAAEMLARSIQRTETEVAP